MWESKLYFIIESQHKSLAYIVHRRILTCQWNSQQGFERLDLSIVVEVKPRAC